MLNWANRFNICCFLDSHTDVFPRQVQSCIAGVSALKRFSSLDELPASANDWLFGHFSYDLKDIIEPHQQQAKPARVQWPELFFFIPETTLELSSTSLRIGSTTANHDRIWEEIGEERTDADVAQKTTVAFLPGMSKQEYLDNVNRIMSHIHRGDCYELNYCQEFYATGIEADPLDLYRKLSNTSPAPFAAYYKTGNRYLISASPERYLRREGEDLISQPIKGTRGRDRANPENDRRLIEELRNDPKERAENIMIVDLVRNDLSRVCREGSVHVEELCGIYSFPQVHQMISTVVGKVPANTGWVDFIKASFPMGSMTGAPKKRVMELIEKYEPVKRGLYSGTLGYVKPNGDFDFNVVIRSLQYDTAGKVLSYHVGSAITGYCDPEKEYEECLVKAKGILDALT
mgnify:CR=1 FL=1